MGYRSWEGLFSLHTSHCNYDFCHFVFQWAIPDHSNTISPIQHSEDMYLSRENWLDYPTQDSIPESLNYSVFHIPYWLQPSLINKVVFVSTLSNGGIFPKVHHNIWQFQMLFYKIRGTSCYSYINSSLGHAVTLRGFILDLAMISETFWSHCTLNSGIRAVRCNFWPWYISICTIDLKVVLSRLYPWDLTFL